VDQTKRTEPIIIVTYSAQTRPNHQEQEANTSDEEAKEESPIIFYSEHDCTAQ
tara:strand:+ start:213 stop:371 length:159 start_codon:yes stop_codon:yes gene_type:complete